jgi:uncharacterized protein
MDFAERSRIDLINANVSETTIQKWEHLLICLSSLPSALVAYSGGVDSSFLAYVTSKILGKKVSAITINSPLEPPETMTESIAFAEQHGIQHKIITLDVLNNPAIQSNPVDRCYHCKTIILDHIWRYARKNQIGYVVEGQNADDALDYRPGSKAVIETGTLSPLLEAGLTKSEIRFLAKVLGLSVWDKPSAPCLATRIPYGRPITEEALKMVSQAEDFLHINGFTVVRVRYIDESASIEVAPDQFDLLLEIRNELVAFFKEIGFEKVVLDLNGYRQGSLNEGLIL